MMDLAPIHHTRPCRRTDIPERARYSQYKADLRADFSQQCGYCGTADYYSGGQRGYHIDHFAPKKRFDTLINSYPNLVYSCPICNGGKSDDWPSEEPHVSCLGNIGYIDPCLPEFDEHLARTTAGKIVALTPLGAYIHKKLKLSLKRREICWLIDKMEHQAKKLDEIIQTKPDNLESLKAYHALMQEYLRYIGILKIEQ